MSLSFSSLPQSICFPYTLFHLSIFCLSLCSLSFSLCFNSSPLLLLPFYSHFLSLPLSSFLSLLTSSLLSLPLSSHFLSPLTFSLLSLSLSSHFPSPLTSSLLSLPLSSHFLSPLTSSLLSLPLSSHFLSPLTSSSSLLSFSFSSFTLISHNHTTAHLRETEWLFSSDGGHCQLAETAGFQRLVIVSLHCGQVYGVLEEVKEEVSAQGMSYLQDGVGSAVKVCTCKCVIYTCI